MTYLPQHLWTQAETGMTTTKQQQRLDYLRTQIRAESISYSEIAELQDLAPHIDAGDLELREWAGIPENQS